MKNQTLINIAKSILKELLSQCTEEEQLQFKRMYSNNHLDMPINEVVDKMNIENIDWAISQCERTIEKKNKIKEENSYKQKEIWENIFSELENKCLNATTVINHLNENYTILKNDFKSEISYKLEKQIIDGVWRDTTYKSYISPKKAIAAYNAMPYHSIELDKKNDMQFRIKEIHSIITEKISDFKI